MNAEDFNEVADMGTERAMEALEIAISGLNVAPFTSIQRTLVEAAIKGAIQNAVRSSPHD